MSFLIRRSPDISLICSSPRLIAACHVLHRLLMPRHSPYALCSLNFLVLFEFYLCLKIAISFLFGCLVEKTLVYHPSAKLYFLPLLFGKTKLNLYCFLSICSFSIPFSKISANNLISSAICLVGLDGLEPSTSRLSGARSNHLSYRPWWR